MVADKRGGEGAPFSLPLALFKIGEIPSVSNGAFFDRFRSSWVGEAGMAEDRHHFSPGTKDSMRFGNRILQVGEVHQDIIGYHQVDRFRLNGFQFGCGIDAEIDMKWVLSGTLPCNVDHLCGEIEHLR